MNPAHHQAHAALKANPNNMDAADFLLAAVKSECAAKQSAISALAAAEQSRAAQVVEIASLRADRDRCADSYQQEKAARIVAEAERDRWRKLATDARPYVDTSPDWLERFDAAKDGS